MCLRTLPTRTLFAAKSELCFPKSSNDLLISLVPFDRAGERGLSSRAVVAESQFPHTAKRTVIREDVFVSMDELPAGPGSVTVNIPFESMT